MATEQELSAPASQGCHAQLDVPVATSLLHYRLPPGEGDFALEPTLKILSDIGGLSSVGIELFSDDFDAMSAQAAGERAGGSLRAVLATQ